MGNTDISIDLDHEDLIDLMDYITDISSISSFSFALLKGTWVQVEEKAPQMYLLVLTSFE